MHAVPEFTNVAELARGFIAETIELLASDEMTFQYEAEPEAIENNHVPGFIPFTSGGFMACLANQISNDESKDPQPIQAIIAANIKDAAKVFCKEHGVELPAEKECLQSWDYYNAVYEAVETDSELVEALQTTCDDWFSEDCYFWKVRALFLMPNDSGNETGEPEIYFDAYLNTDLNYGRDSVDWLKVYGGNPDQTRGNWKKTITVRQLERLAKRVGAERLADALAKKAFASLSSI